MPALDPLVEGVYEHRLSRRAQQILDDPELDDADRALAIRARDTCTLIGERVERERNRLIELLRADGLDVEPAGDVGPRQNHTIELRVGSHADARTGRGPSPT